MARLFTAVELGASARDAIVREQRAMLAALGRSGEPGVRPVPSAHLHLTLVFIGEIADERVDAFAAAMREDVALAPFAIEFDRPGIFPSHGAPRVLWIGVGRGASRLAELQATVVSRLRPLGLLPDARPYRPHLTIARWKGEHARRPRRPLPAVAVPVREQVHGVTLFRSHLRPGGPEHVPLATARLIGGAADAHEGAAGLH